MPFMCGRSSMVKAAIDRFPCKVWTGFAAVYGLTFKAPSVSRNGYSYVSVQFINITYWYSLEAADSVWFEHRNVLVIV